jgi:hypothetical protein
MRAGFASGLASWLLALPDLAARNRGVQDSSPSAFRSLAEDGLAALAQARQTRFGPGIPALRAATLAGPILGFARCEPEAVLEGRLALPEGRKRLRLLWAAVRGGW